MGNWAYLTNYSTIWREGNRWNDWQSLDLEEIHCFCFYLTTSFVHNPSSSWAKLSIQRFSIIYELFSKTFEGFPFLFHLLIELISPGLLGYANQIGLVRSILIDEEFVAPTDTDFEVGLVGQNMLFWITFSVGCANPSQFSENVVGNWFMWCSLVGDSQIYQWSLDPISFRGPPKDPQFKKGNTKRKILNMIDLVFLFPSY